MPPKKINIKLSPDQNPNQKLMYQLMIQEKKNY